MAASGASEGITRILGLGNDLLADDACGLLVARQARRRFPDQVDVVCSSAAGFDLLDQVLGAARLLVVDTVLTGSAPPGTIHTFSVDPDQPLPGGSPHFLGLFEVLAVGRKLHLPVPAEVIVFAIEAADCTTVGGPMHPRVASAVSQVLDQLAQLLASDRGSLPWTTQIPSGSP